MFGLIFDGSWRLWAVSGSIPDAPLPDELCGWGRGDFRSQIRDLQSLLREVEGRDLGEEEVSWVLRLALRKQEGGGLTCLRDVSPT